MPTPWPERGNLQRGSCGAADGVIESDYSGGNPDRFTEMPMDPYSPLILVILGLALLAVDILLLGGASIILPIVAIGVLAAAGAGAFGLTTTGQIAAGAIGSLVAVPLVVLISRRLRRRGKEPSDDQRLLEDTFTITLRGDRPGISHRADFFPARHVRGDRLQRGQRVRVIRIEGVTALVDDADDASGA